MKPFILLSAFSLLGLTAHGQALDTTQRTQITDHRLTEDNLFKGPKPVNLEMIPPMLIILNYKRVITLEEYMQVKKNGDIIKEYTIKSDQGKEVEEVMIVESKNKVRYLNFGKR